MSDIPGEIVKHLPQVVAVATGAAVASSDVVKDLVKRMLGPAADEVGLWGKDKINAYRTKNATKVLEEAGKMLHEAKIEPEPVGPKILLPLLEGASLEESEDLRIMYAALLVSASQSASKAPPSFVGVLRQSSPDEMRLLTLLYEVSDEKYSDTGNYDLSCDEIAKRQDGHFVIARERLSERYEPSRAKTELVERLEVLHDELREAILDEDENLEEQLVRDLNRELTHETEALWRDWLVEKAENDPFYSTLGPQVAYTHDQLAIRLCFEALQAHGLVESRFQSTSFSLTLRGAEFLHAVTPPKPQPKS
jgi:Abortive infection alpha